MFRGLILFSIVMAINSSALADASGNAFSANATRFGDKVTVEMQLSQSGTEIINGKPISAVTTSSPRITLEEGKRSTLILGSTKAAATTIASPDELTSGCRVDVISVKGTDKLIVTASIIDNGSVIWADSKAIDVDVHEEK
jgi:hypothetical protein